jgi:hypothetical protein
MRRDLRILLPVLAAACASAGGARFAEATYVCDGGRSFRAEVTPSRATVRLPNGRVYQLQRAELPDHYTDGRVNLVADRRYARLVTPEALYSFCRRATPD